MSNLIPESITKVRAIGYRSRTDAKAKALLKRQAKGVFLDRRERRAVQQYLSEQAASVRPNRRERRVQRLYSSKIAA